MCKTFSDFQLSSVWATQGTPSLENTGSLSSPLDTPGTIFFPFCLPSLCPYFFPFFIFLIALTDLLALITAWIPLFFKTGGSRTAFDISFLSQVPCMDDPTVFFSLWEISQPHSYLPLSQGEPAGDSQTLSNQSAAHRSFFSVSLMWWTHSL